MIRGSVFVYYALVLYFGAQTLSRSFLVLFVVLTVIFIFDLFLNQKYKTAMVFFTLLIVAFILIVNSKITIFQGIIDRFINASEGDITGNRTNIYSAYIDYFSENPLQLIFGSGVGASYLGSVAAHNTYIDFLYYYGILGTILFVIVLASILCNVPKTKKNISNYIPSVCIAISIFFLSDLIYFDFVFNLIMWLFVFTTYIKKNRELQRV